MTTEIVTSGKIRDGKMTLRNRRRIEEWASKMKDCELLITFEKAHATRSHLANALYWAGYVRPLADHTGYTPQEIHAYLKKRFLPKHRIEIVDKQTGVVLDEQDLDQLTTTTLTNVEFSEYLHEIAEFAATLNVTVGSNREDAA